METSTAQESPSTREAFREYQSPMELSLGLMYKVLIFLTAFLVALPYLVVIISAVRLSRLSKGESSWDTQPDSSPKPSPAHSNGRFQRASSQAKSSVLLEPEAVERTEP